jgi:hypothetical protein
MNKINSYGQTNTIKNVYNYNADTSLSEIHTSSLILVGLVSATIILPASPPIGWNCKIKNVSTGSILIAGTIDGQGSYILSTQSCAEFINNGTVSGYSVTNDLYIIEPRNVVFPTTSIVDGQFGRTNILAFTDVLRFGLNDFLQLSYNFPTNLMENVPMNFSVRYCPDKITAGSFDWSLSYQPRSIGTIVTAATNVATSSVASPAVINKISEANFNLISPFTNDSISFLLKLTGRPAVTNALITECYLTYYVQS